MFHVLAQFLFTKRAMELDYYDQKGNVQVAPKLSKNIYMRIFGNYEISRKSLKCFYLMASIQPVSQKVNFDVCSRIFRTINCKMFRRKTYFT